MHELSLFKNLLRKIASISEENEGKKIVVLTIKLGALCHLSADHFREHFEQFSVGTAAEGALLEIEECADYHAPDAQEMVLQSVEIEV